MYSVTLQSGSCVKAELLLSANILLLFSLAE